MKNENTQKLVVNQAENQFEWPLDGDKAVIEYVLQDEKMHLVHTEVPEAYRGHNIASKLTKAVLEHAKQHNLTVVPTCPYIAKYIDNHPEYHTLLSEGYQM